MEYLHTVQATFLSRPNRFIAEAMLEGQKVICHVKNTGRCRELLVPGATVVLSRQSSPSRATAFDLVAVYKGRRLINMDSQAPNKAAAAFLPTLFPGYAIRPEVKYGASRFDFMLDGPQPGYLEVKGVTLEENGAVYFPDAPTERGVRHVLELCRCAEAGLTAWLLFVVQMEDVRFFSPNDRTDPQFGQALRYAAQHGVHLLAYDCRVTEHAMALRRPVEIRL